MTTMAFFYAYNSYVHDLSMSGNTSICVQVHVVLHTLAVAILGFPVSTHSVPFT